MHYPPSTAYPTSILATSAKGSVKWFYLSFMWPPLGYCHPRANELPTFLVIHHTPIIIP